MLTYCHSRTLTWGFYLLVCRLWVFGGVVWILASYWRLGFHIFRFKRLSLQLLLRLCKTSPVSELLYSCLRLLLMCFVYMPFCVSWLTYLLMFIGIKDYHTMLAAVNLFFVPIMSVCFVHTLCQYNGILCDCARFILL